MPSIRPIDDSIGVQREDDDTPSPGGISSVGILSIVGVFLAMLAVFVSIVHHQLKKRYQHTATSAHSVASVASVQSVPSVSSSVGSMARVDSTYLAAPASYAGENPYESIHSRTQSQASGYYHTINSSYFTKAPAAPVANNRGVGRRGTGGYKPPLGVRRPPPKGQQTVHASPSQASGFYHEIGSDFFRGGGGAAGGNIQQQRPVAGVDQSESQASGYYHTIPSSFFKRH